jgi:hypothetical protein
VVLAEDHPAMAIELRELLIADYDVVEIVHDGAALIEAARRRCLTRSSAISRCHASRARRARRFSRPTGRAHRVRHGPGQPVGDQKAIDSGARGVMSSRTMQVNDSCRYALR